MQANQLRAVAVAAAFFGASLGAAQGLAAEGNESLDVLLDEGKVTLDFRYRYEFVDDGRFDEEANASTLRTRLGFQSGVWRGWDFNMEVNDVRELLANDFNAGGGTTPDRTEYPVVPDPKGTRLNQAYVNYTGIDDWGFKVGRQRINLDNQRFVGAVGWRQTEQVFDAGTVAWGTEKADFSATYVQWVRRIFGQESSAGKHRQDGTVFLNGGLAMPFGRLRGYYYHIDDEDDSAFSTGTIGARFTGMPAINDDWSIRYQAEYAHQNDVGNNPVNYSADYLHLSAAAVTGIFDFGLGWELLGGDEGDDGYAAFRTPLATLHKFNGWADQFLSTPSNGLSDLYLNFKATPGDFIFDARLHNFKADSGSDEFGTELDFRAGYRFTDRLRGDLFLAVFDADNDVAGFDDVTKFWVQVYLDL